MNADQISKSVEIIRTRCLEQARAEMVERITRLQDVARNLVDDIAESVGGHRLTAEDLCNAALQPNGITHPRIAQAVSERADVLLAALIEMALGQMAGTPQAAEKRGSKRAA